MGIESSILETTDSLKNFQHNFAKFYTSNYMFLIIASAVSIGIATKDMVSTIMNESILPILDVFLVHSIPYILYLKSLEFSAKYPITNMIVRKLGRMFWIIIVWMLILYVTFIVFKAMSNVDLITSQSNMVQAVTKYIAGESTTQERPIRQDGQYMFTNRF